VEANYWKVVRAKSTPFYGAAYEIGALLGNAHPEIVQGLYELGTIIGEIIQIEDDLTDAFQNPANADWHQGRNNLLILYALTAEHPSQERFVTLRAQIANPERLEEAQQILIASGAVSYCAFHLVTRYQAARRLLDSLHLYDPTPIQDTLENYADSLLALLQMSGVKVSRELLLDPSG
jgi:geranylgeranyl pyrophosphate synthase